MFKGGLGDFPQQARGAIWIATGIACQYYPEFEIRRISILYAYKKRNGVFCFLNNLVLFEKTNYNESGGAAMDYMTLKEASEIWGVTPRWINYYCSSGRISGAVKMGTVWLIPKGAQKPADRRFKSIRSKDGENK